MIGRVAGVEGFGEEEDGEDEGAELDEALRDVSLTIILYQRADLSAQECCSSSSSPDSAR